MLFHVTAEAEFRGSVGMSAAMRSTVDEMKAEGVVISAACCVDGSGYFFVIEAGDVDEVASEIARLSEVTDQPLQFRVTEVRSA